MQAVNKFNQIQLAARSIYNETIDNGGNTYALDGKAYGTYVVGNNSLFPTQGNVFAAANFTPAALVPFLYAAEALGYDGVGTWLDPGSGNIYIDLVRFYDDFEEARLAGLQNGELAVFNRRTNQVINL